MWMLRRIMLKRTPGMPMDWMMKRARRMSLIRIVLKATAMQVHMIEHQVLQPGPNPC